MTEPPIRPILACISTPDRAIDSAVRQAIEQKQPYGIQVQWVPSRNAAEIVLSSGVPSMPAGVSWLAIPDDMSQDALRTMADQFWAAADRLRGGLPRAPASTIPVPTGPERL